MSAKEFKKARFLRLLNFLFDLDFQLWDLTSGKLLHDFKQHTAAVNCVEFHPKEFLLATASNDRFVVHIVLLPLAV